MGVGPGARHGPSHHWPQPLTPSSCPGPTLRPRGSPFLLSSPPPAVPGRPTCLQLGLGDFPAAVEVQRGEGVPDGLQQLLLEAHHGRPAGSRHPGLAAAALSSPLLASPLPPRGRVPALGRLRWRRPGSRARPAQSRGPAGASGAAASVCPAGAAQLPLARCGRGEGRELAAVGGSTPRYGRHRLIATEKNTFSCRIFAQRCSLTLAST